MGAELVLEPGIGAVMSSVVAPMTLEEVSRQSPKLIYEAIEQLFRIIKPANGNEHPPTVVSNI